MHQLQRVERLAAGEKRFRGGRKPETVQPKTAGGGVQRGVAHLLLDGVQSCQVIVCQGGAQPYRTVEASVRVGYRRPAICGGDIPHQAGGRQAARKPSQRQQG